MSLLKRFCFWILRDEINTFQWKIVCLRNCLEDYAKDVYQTKSGEAARECLLRTDC